MADVNQTAWVAASRAVSSLEATPTGASSGSSGSNFRLFVGSFADARRAIRDDQSPVSNTAASDVAVMRATKALRCAASTFITFGKAATIASAIMSPGRLPLVNANARTPALTSAALSFGWRRIRVSFVNTTHPFLPTTGSQSVSDVPARSDCRAVPPGGPRRRDDDPGRVPSTRR